MEKRYATMRKTLIAVLLTVVFAAPALGAAIGNTYRLTVDGLACPFCAYGVEKQLTAVDGVGKVAVDIASGTVTVTMNGDRTLDEATTRRAVEKAGFTLRAFEKASPPK